MEIMKRNLFLSALGGIMVVVILSLVFAGCDLFEAEVTPESKSVNILQKSIVITRGSSGIFDLRSVVAPTGNKRIAITSQPSLGTLKSLGHDVMKYTPNAGIIRGRDKLMVSVLSLNNVVEKEDSVIFEITSDATGFPCNPGVNALNDLVYDVTGPIEIDVLANDTACNVPRAKLQVSIPENLSIDGVPVPKSYYGTVEALANGKIRYTPGAEFKGSDKFIYQVIKPENLPNPGDYATLSYGFVYISQQSSSCKDSLLLQNDAFSYKLDSLNRADSLYLNTAANDVICTRALNNFVFTITEFPVGGLYYSYDYGFKYIIPASATAGSSDKFKYKVCVDDVCKEAEVNLSFK